VPACNDTAMNSENYITETDTDIPNTSVEPDIGFTEKNTSFQEKLNCFQVEQHKIKEIPGSSFTIVHDSMWNELLKNLPCDECG
jgi:hypothetical protein